MGRRSDHTREELLALITAAGHAQMADAGFSRFSAREVAKRVGYSIGTIYNVFGSYDRLILAINARTLDLWAAHLSAILDRSIDDRLAALVHGYFSFAQANPRTWSALYDHRLPPDDPMPDWYRAKLARLFGLIEAEIAQALGGTRERSAELARGLYAAVHGVCSLRINGALAALGVEDAEGLAIGLVHRQIDAARRDAQG